jgi:hypothetical protein
MKENYAAVPIAFPAASAARLISMIFVLLRAISLNPIKRYFNF